MAKRPIKPVEEEDEGDGNEEEEEEVVHVHKAAKPTINQKPTPISSVDSDEAISLCHTHLYLLFYYLSMLMN